MEKQKINKLQDIKNLLEVRTDEIANSINKKLESELRKSENKIIRVLEEKSYQSLENIETYVSQFLEKDMIQNLEDIKERNKKFLYTNFNDLFLEVKLIIKNYSEELNQTNKISFFDSEIKRKIEDFKSEKDEIEKLKKEIFYKKMDYNNEKTREKWEIQKFEKFKTKKERLEKIRNIRNSELEDLDKKPQIEIEINYEKEVENSNKKSGFFSKLSDKIFGKKAKKVEALQEDDNKQIQKDEGKGNFSENMENLDILDDFDEEEVLRAKRIDSIKREEIKLLEEMLREKKEALKKAQEKTKEEYVKNIVKNVRNYFSSQSNQIKNVFFREMISEKKMEIMKKTEIEYKNLLN